VHEPIAGYGAAVHAGVLAATAITVAARRQQQELVRNAFDLGQ